ncbi:hypothetical protein K0M31_010806 [Melipona bicolor]|uniref:Uncharacterized protein n=1 Tax=Melipona bicolor TaxID=60889 RepID=A0AA40KHZ4_9HYME|nr:hypothetical protein K0M31_010806 [Melipona bicolor]
MAVLFVNNVKAVFAVLTAIVLYVSSQSSCAAFTTKEFARELEKLARETILDDREIYRTENLEKHSKSDSYGGDESCMEWNPYDSGTRMFVVFMAKLRLCVTID